MTKYTPNYDLDQYEATDVPNLADQYNNAMGKIDTALHLQAGDVAGVANKISTINQAIAGINTEIEGVNGEIQGLTAELAALGITDAATAAELLEKIEGHGSAITALTTVQEQHAQEISDVMGDVSAIEADYVNYNDYVNAFTLEIFANACPQLPGTLYMSKARNNSAFKLWGSVAKSDQSGFDVTYETVPGSSNGTRGIKTNVKVPWTVSQARGISLCSLVIFRLDSDVFGGPPRVAVTSYAIGTDSCVYIDAGRTSTPTSHYTTLNVVPLQMLIGNADWTVALESAIDA